MRRSLGAFDDDVENFDNPELNKCPDSPSVLKDTRRMMCSAAAEHDVPFGYDARLRLMMCASRMSGTHRIIATKGSSIIFAKRQKHHLPDRANIIHFGRLAHKRPACRGMRQKTG